MQILERLTEREREVLGHLSELHTTEEIAEEMFTTVNTVRTHVRIILRMIAASRRSEAVRRARRAPWSSFRSREVAEEL